MSDRPLLLKLLGEQRKRLVGSILGHVESADWYTHLDADDRDDLRDVVLEAVGRFYDLTRDLHAVLRDEGVTNERSVELLESIYREVRKASR